jgi:hypothetical protein
VPATVTAPDVAVEGVSPVEPNEIDVTGDDALLCASNVTTPELFSKYSLPSLMFIANSPGTKFAARGTALAVVLWYKLIGV